MRATVTDRRYKERFMGRKTSWMRPRFCMRLCHVVLLGWLMHDATFAADADGAAPKPAQSFAFEQKADRVIISRAGRLVAQYVFQDDKILRPYFAQVHTPDGIPITRNHPPIPGQDPVDHDTMHPGIWLAFGDIAGHDFWRNKAAIRHERFTEPPTMRDGKLTFATRSQMLASNGQMLSELLSRFTLTGRSESYLLVWEATFTPATDGFYFGDQEEMGFGVRVATQLAEDKGGSLISSSNEKTAKATWGKAYEWCDYSGVVKDRQVGVTLMPDPRNFRPSWWHNRAYGLSVANPFGRKAMKQGETSRVEVKKGESFRLSFGVWIHSAPNGQQVNIAEAYRDFVKGIER
jgi:hypothetical protein